MNEHPTSKWTFSTIGLPEEARPVFDLVVETLGSKKAGLDYMGGILEKRDTHEEMLKLLVEVLSNSDVSTETAKAAVSILDHIQEHGHEWSWFRKPAKLRAAYSNCDASFLWDKSRSLTSTEDANEAQPTNRKRSKKLKTHAELIEDFYQIEAAVRRFLQRPDPQPLAMLGCLEALLITRCAVITRATLNGCMVALKSPIVATKDWWYLNVTHHSGKNERLELRRIFLDPVTASLAMRWHSNITSLFENISTTENQKVIANRAFKEFARQAGMTHLLNVSDALQAANAWLAVTIPSFLLAVASRKRTSHSMPDSAWRRLQGLLPLSEPSGITGGQYWDLIDANVATQDMTTLSLLLSVIGPDSEETLTTTSNQLNTLPPTDRIFMEWLTSQCMNRRRARRIVLLLGKRVQEALTDRTFPLPTEVLAAMRGFLTEDLEKETVVTLADAFVDWLASSPWSEQDSTDEDDEDRPGVSANILAPHELNQLIEHLRSPACGIADANLRDILRNILELGCLGMRRAEALKLRATDFRATTHAPDLYPIIAIEPYPGRGLKSISSCRYAPARLLSPELLAAFSKVRGGKTADMLINEYQQTSHSDQTIWLTANRIMQQFLQDASLHLHHCRHTAATLFLIQLMAAPLGLHRYYGRCHFLDNLLESAEHTADVLTLKNPSSLMHLRAISMLLGHLSPLITLKTYVHCCDLLIYAALDRSGETGYSKLLSLASGRPIKTVKNHQCLPAAVCEHLAHQTIPSPHQLTSDGYTLLRMVERQFPNAVRRDDSPLALQVAFRTEGPTFDTIAELMTQIAHSPTTEEMEVARTLLGIDIPNAQAMCEALPKLRKGLMTKIAEDWTRRLHIAYLQLHPEQKATWSTDLRFLFNNIDSHRSILRVRNEPGSIVVIEIIKKLGFKVSDWIIRPPQSRGGPIPDFRTFRTWRDISNAGRPLQLRPALPSDSFSYEGVRWAVLGHLLFLELRNT